MAALAKPDARFIDDLATAHRLTCEDADCGQDTPEALIGELGDDAVVDGRIVRIALSFNIPRVIDLRGLDALEEVTIDADEPNEALILGDHPRLTILRYESDRTRLEIKRAALDLGGCTALREAHLDGSKIAALSNIPGSLRVLSIRHNPIDALDLAVATGLEELFASRTQLTSLDLAGLAALRELWIEETPLATLDLRANTKLTRISARDTPLTELDAGHLTSLVSLSAGASGQRIQVRLPQPSRLADLRITGGDLEEFDTRAHPALEILRLTNGGLRSLVADHPTLHWLDVENNQLAALDLDKVPATKCLQLDGNPLTRIDISPLAKLGRDRLWISFPGAASIVCTERQQRTLPVLCERSGLSKPTTKLADMDAYLLHDYVNAYNWDDGPKPLRKVIEHPRCDLATALYVYWMSEPGEHTAYKKPSDVPSGERHARPWVELLREIEKRVAAGRYKTAMIPFDVRDVDGTDLSDDDARIPAVMREAIRVEAGAIVEIPPAGVRPTSSASTKAAPRAKPSTTKATTKSSSKAKKPAAEKAKKPAAAKAKKPMRSKKAPAKKPTKRKRR